MENIIIKSINSKSVQDMAKNSRLKEIDVWSLFFDSGCDYLDQLQNRITHYSVFKAQFGELMDAVSLKKTPAETFRCILVSPHFWNWWSSQLWRVCYYFNSESQEEIYIRLMFNTSLIPQNVLFKIFTDGEQQKNSTEQSRMPGIIRRRSAQVC